MGSSPVTFGKPMRDQFLFADGYIQLNHGSFGTYPKLIRDDLRKWQDLSEARPDSFIRYDYPRLLDSACMAIAAYLDVPVQNLIFVPNATTGFNTVLRSLVFGDGDVIIHFSTIYSACAKTVEYICETTPARSFNIKVEYPIRDDDLIKKFVEGLEQVKADGKKVKVAVFDTISSMPGVSVPWESLVQICRSHGVLSLVDGAHGVGQIELNLGRAEPDFFISNLHKWLYVPRGCSILYVPKYNQHLIRSSLPTSHGFVPIPREGCTIHSPFPEAIGTPFTNLFKFGATMDNSPYLCVHEALRFRKEVCGGEEKIYSYCTKLAADGGRRMAEILGTNVMEEQGSNPCFFANIRLPVVLANPGTKLDEHSAIKIVQWIAAMLDGEHGTFVGIYLHAGHLWARLSAQIYLELQDIENGAKALKGLCRRASNGEYLRGTNYGSGRHSGANASASP